MKRQYTYEDYLIDYQGYIDELNDCSYYPYYSKGDDYKRVLDSLHRFEQNYIEFTRLYLGEDYINDSLHLTE